MMKNRMKVVALVCAAMVVLHLINEITGGHLVAFGIYPRDLRSLPFIYTAPWLHGSWIHLINNLVSMMIFSALCLLRGVGFFVRSSAIIITLTGLLVWLFARSGAYHVGASGWIFGLWSLSIAIAWFQRSFFNIVIAVFVAIFYGGMAWGVLPLTAYISFESHFFGALAGVITAYLMTRPGTRHRS